MEGNLQKNERLIREINRLHAQYPQDYFETGKVRKINLSHTLKNVPTGHILSYRLNLHEAVNDYLAFADTRGIDFSHRVKTSESIHDKISRYPARGNQYPANNILNDIFGAQLIWPSETVALNCRQAALKPFITVHKRINHKIHNRIPDFSSNCLRK